MLARIQGAWEHVLPRRVVSWRCEVCEVGVLEFAGFCFVFVELREEKKRAVFGGMPDVSKFYDEAKSIFANPLY